MSSTDAPGVLPVAQPGSPEALEEHGSARAMRAWRRLWWSSALLPVLVLLPLVNQPLRADHRFNVFRFGGDLTQRPWEIVTQPLTTVPSYLNHGNFRPLGRMVERGQDLLAFAVSGALDLPVTTALRLVDLTFVALLALATVLWAETVSSRQSVLSRPPSAIGLVTALALPVTLVATRGSAVVLYTALYFASGALVLLVAAASARRRWFETTPVRTTVLITAGLVGGALAAFNEVGYLAAPLAVLTVATRGLVTLGLSVTDLARSSAVRVLLSGLAGFAVVFLPVRAVIAQRCREGGCYAASDVELSTALIPTLGHRLVSALPGAGWSAAADRPADLLPAANPAMLVVLGLVALLALVVGGDVARRQPPSMRRASAAVVSGLGLTLLTSVAMSMGSEVQKRVFDGWPIGNGWRDLPLTASASAVLLAGAGLAVVRVLRERWGFAHRGAAVALVVLVGAASLVTTSVNRTVAFDGRPDREAELFDRISLALLHFEPSDESARCSLIAEFEAIHPGHVDWHTRLDEALDSAAVARHDTPWCAAEGR